MCITCCCMLFFFFFFQAEDGIRDVAVTGVQTCALPISLNHFILAKSALPNSSSGQATVARRSLGAAVDVQRAPEPSARAARVRNSRRLEGMLSPREGFPDGNEEHISFGRISREASW